MKGELRTCDKGHRYYKSSDCPTCPQCETKKKPNTGFLSVLSAPARRALDNAGINSTKKLAGYSEKELFALHGFGKSSIPRLRKELQKEGLDLKK